ncbi:MAG: hypothetical protein O9301_05230 [Leptospira sp.]|nr:hypothetical protein [Leptospira sp.]
MVKYTIQKIVSFQVSLAVFFFIVAYSPTLNAETKFDFPNTSSGQYIFYYDSRRDAKRLTGIMKFYDGTIVCRTFDAIEKTNTIVSLKILKTDKEYEVIPDRIFAGDFNRDVQYVLVDLNNILNQQLKHSNKITDKKNAFMDPWPEFGYELEHVFWKHIPFMGLYSTRRTDLKDPFYQAVIIGRMADANDVNFFNLDLPIFKEKLSAKFEIPTKQSKIINHAGYSITLDERWNRIEANKIPEIKHETYWFSVDSLRDAQIGIEKIDISDFPNQSKIKTVKDLGNLILRSHPILLAESIAIVDLPNGDLQLDFVSLEFQSRYRTKHIYRIKKLPGNKFEIVNFSAFYETYTLNESYFLEVLKSIKPE